MNKVWFNVQNASGSWVYGTIQIYTAPCFMMGFVNGSYTFYAFANNTVGSFDSDSVAFTLGIPEIEPEPTAPSVSVVQPFNKTYVTGTIPVELSTTGSVDAAWFNVKNGSVWVYAFNLTYTAATSLTGFVNGSYTFYAFAANSEGGFAEDNVVFTVEIPPPPSEYEVARETIFGNMYIAVGLIGTSFIVLACFLIVRSLQSGNADSGALLFGVIFLIGSVVGLIVGFAIIVGFEGSMSNVLFLLFRV